MLGGGINIEGGHPQRTLQSQSQFWFMRRPNGIVLVQFRGCNWQDTEQLMLGLFTICKYNIMMMLLEDIVGCTAHNLVAGPIGIHSLNHKNLVIILGIDGAADELGLVVVFVVALLHADGFLVGFADDHVVVSFGEGLMALFCLHHYTINTGTNSKQQKKIPKMTTITNFLLTNFLDNKIDQKDRQEYEVPIWVVNGSRDKNIKALKQYMIENCINTNKAVVRLDFGISVLRLCRDWQDRQVVQDGLQVVIPHKDKPYYIITLNSSFRSQTNISIPAVMKVLNNISTYVKDQQTNKPKTSISLIIEGLQIIATQKNGTINLQSFITHIPILNPVFKQITVFKYGEILLPQHQFALERISTCLTDVQQYDGTLAMWVVKSTVRRLTGFSNQEKYTIKTMKNSKLKVQKWVAAKTQQETQSHKQMVSELGFVVKKKDEAAKTQQLKKMIYPHLRMQEGCKCNKKQCATCTVDNNDLDGLIILDDEQEDDDDIDV